MNKPNQPASPGRTSVSRREFLGTSAAAAAGLMVVPRHVVGATQKKKAPSDTLNIGCIGVGGKGFSDVQAASTENIVALCDVDDVMMADFLRSDKHEPDKSAMYAKARTYRDFRKMLEKEKALDAVTVSTPDHTHAVAAMAAMKLGKHVFCQKPLTHTVKEARILAKTARELKLVTQMGNQGHAKEGARLICEWIWAGAIGNVTEVHAEPADLAAGRQRTEGDPGRALDPGLGLLDRSGAFPSLPSSLPSL
jgi:predicted dehydrogenase